METITTKVHAYHFDITKPAALAAWLELRARLRAGWPHRMKSSGANDTHYAVGKRLDGQTVTLETRYLFDNQWNTAAVLGEKEGPRVFDWAQDYLRSANYRQGYYLEQTEAMRTVRHATLVCGYCGKQEPAATHLKFCPHCLDGEYLKASELHLTRMIRVDQSGPGRSDRPPLTDEERAERLPLYQAAQLYGTTERGKARLAKARADVIAKAEKEIRAATVERDGFLWFMDRGIRTDNLLYYSHTGRFCFGWRSPVDDELRSALLDIVSEFPFPYDIKTDDGRTLSGG